jgi:hypothetical protein
MEVEFELVAAFLTSGRMAGPNNRRRTLICEYGWFDSQATTVWRIQASAFVTNPIGKTLRV